MRRSFLLDHHELKKSTNRQVVYFVVYYLCVCVQIFYKVSREIFPGEELLLFMKTEDFTCDNMAPDIHGSQQILSLTYTHTHACTHTYARTQIFPLTRMLTGVNVLISLPPSMQRRGSTTVRTATSTLNPLTSCLTTGHVECPLLLTLT